MKATAPSRLTGAYPWPAPGWLGSEGRVHVAGGQIDGERDRAATLPAFRLHQSAPVAHPMLADCHLGASGANGAHMGRAVAGDRDGATMRADAAAMLGAIEQ